MGLNVNTLSCTNFRNYRKFGLDDIGPLTIFTGPNAIGKTNLIEAIQLLTALTSLKNATAQQLVTWGETTSRVAIGVTDGRRDLTVQLDIFEEKKHYFLNGKKKRPKELRGIIPSVLFSPDDLTLIKGTQSIKRAFLDHVGMQMSANYGVIKRDYEKILHHKNSLLKEDPTFDLLESVNDTLVTVGAQLSCYRYALFNRLSPYLKNYYERIADGKEEVEAIYVPSWVTADPETRNRFVFDREEAHSQLAKAVSARQSEEIQRRRSIVGPHADRLEFFINEKNAGIYGSQGQQRSLVLALKLAEVEVIKEITQQKPILLLDDVMSELDVSRRNALMDFIVSDIQTFITTTHLEYFTPELLSSAQVVDLVSFPEGLK